MTIGTSITSRSGRLHLAGALAVAALLFGGCATSPPEPAEIVDVEEVTATVTAIDHAKRLVTLRTPAGVEDTFEVSPEVRNLDQVKVGDVLSVRYYEGIAAEVTTASPEDEVGVIEVGGGRAPLGERPGGAVGSSVSAIVTIESVDTRRNTVTFRGADGLIRAIDVRRPEMQQFIRGLKPGDKVRVTFSEALAIDVRPAS
ncbi:MAG TPA: hypothetical protein VLT59_12420 [Steroidobacteraceae bacterium]|nr:hypothetical protein [Steroidobacteraceae bacterium]